MNRLRRHVLIALSLLPASRVVASDQHDAALRRLLAVCDDPVAAARLGGHCQQPDGTTPRQVLARILHRLHISESRFIDLGDRPLRDAIGRSVRADFAASETVALKGWKLARTEAEICWLHHLAATRV